MEHELVLYAEAKGIKDGTLGHECKPPTIRGILPEVDEAYDAGFLAALSTWNTHNV